MFDNPEIIPLLPLWYVVFLLSITCHEAAHAWAAYLGGDETAYLGGQVSLNPIPHMQREIVGTVVFPLLSYFWWGGGWMMGWASAPYDPYWEDRHPRRAALMAAAGPAANLLLALLGFAVLKIGVLRGWWLLSNEYTLDNLVTTGSTETTLAGGLASFCSILFGLNLILMLFNLIPVPPLDGASVLAGLVPPARALRDVARGNAMTAMAGIVVAWLVADRVLWPVYQFVVRLAFYWP
ncbi:MAG: site-2 protease family protein [bacterium]|nr:site-2 protease family protein [bacterium]